MDCNFDHSPCEEGPDVDRSRLTEHEREIMQIEKDCARDDVKPRFCARRSEAMTDAAMEMDKTLTARITMPLIDAALSFLSPEPEATVKENLTVQPAPEAPKEHHCGRPHPHLRQACISGIWQCDECKAADEAAHPAPKPSEEDFQPWWKSHGYLTEDQALDVFSENK